MVGYVIFHRVFNAKFNISFFVPKKDVREAWVAFENANTVEKELSKIDYEKHLLEKIYYV